METIEVITTLLFICPMCKHPYSNRENVEKCVAQHKLSNYCYETLKDKVGTIIKFTVRDKFHYVLIGKIQYTEKEFCVSAMDSNDLYHTNWFKKEWVLLSIEEAVAEGWRPFTISTMQRFKENLKYWDAYVEAMRKIPYEQLFNEAIYHITKRRSVGD